MKSLTAKFLVGLATICLLLGGSFVFFMSDCYEPGTLADAALQSDDVVTVTVDQNLIFEPKEKEASSGFILYPGAKVAAEAYAPLGRELAREGYKVVILKMPLNFAMLGIDKAKDVIEADDCIESWTVGGHSLGGVAASMFASTSESVDGVVFLAAYPAGDELKDTTKVITSIWGTKDQVLNHENLNESKQVLPQETIYLELEGGNHSQFGDYGLQAGDGQATLSEESQLALTVNQIVSSLDAASQRAE